MTLELTRRLYDEYPYPLPDAGNALLHDIASVVGLSLEDDDLRDWRVLDAGCGTAHRLLGLAQQYPKAQFVGLDISGHSLEIAHRLALLHNVSNVTFIQHTVGELPLDQTFDVIVATGLIHHLPDPRAGVAWLAQHLTRDGLLFAWVYHGLGEHDRLVARALVWLLGSQDGTAPSLEQVRELGLHCAPDRYGPTEALPLNEMAQTVRDADAFLNPVVHAWRFDDLRSLLDRASLDWVAINGLTLPAGGRLVDLRGNEERLVDLCLDEKALFPGPTTRALFRALSDLDRIRAIELRVRPTGFSFVAGRGQAASLCAPRVRGNAMDLAQL